MSLRLSGAETFKTSQTDVPVLEHLGSQKLGQTESGSRLEEIGGQKVPSSSKNARKEGGQKLPSSNVHLRRATAVGVGVLTALRVLTAIGTLGISEGIKAGIDRAIENYGTKNTPKTPIEVTLPGTGEKVTVDRSMLPRRIPKDMTPGELQQKIQEKVTAGHQLVQQLTNDAYTGGRCTVKDMTNIMFFLQLKAEAGPARGHFMEGAFTLSDPGQRIRSFLDSCPKSYQRESSHISAFQKMTGGRHRGLDAGGDGKNFDELLPNGMKTLLYGTIQKNDGLKMPEDRLYLKIESHGAWLTRPKGGGDAGGPHRTGNIHDVGAILGHSLSFVSTRGKGSAAGTFKERIPDLAKNPFNEIVKNAPEHLKKTLLEGDPTSSSAGIRIMLANLDQVRGEIDPDTHPECWKAMKTFDDNVQRLYPRPELRVGNEIIFTQEDFT